MFSDGGSKDFAKIQKSREMIFQHIQAATGAMDPSLLTDEMLESSMPALQVHLTRSQPSGLMHKTHVN